MFSGFEWKVEDEINLFQILINFINIGFYSVDENVAFKILCTNRFLWVR